MNENHSLDIENMSIKEEPLEEFPYAAETVLVEPSMDLEDCNLCRRGKFLLKILKDHFRIFHPDSENQNELCACPDGVKLQVDIINHLLFHIVEVKQEQDIDSIKNIKADESPCSDLSSKEDPETNSESELEFQSFEKNKKTKIKKIPKQFSCDTCTKTFQSKSGLKLHFNVEHNPSYNKFICELCLKVFKHKQGLNTHWDLEHNPINIFPCIKSDCKIRLKTLTRLNIHLKSHETKSPRDATLGELQCPKCLRNFSTQKQLLHHSYSHREKIFTCDKCGMKFNNRSQIQEHIKRHLGIKKDKPKIMCDQCSTMIFSHRVAQHIKIHHMNFKPHKCTYAGCNAAFSESRGLNDHLNIHLNLKPYKCDFCPETFRSSANMRQHRVRHTDPDRFRCEECQTSFVTKQALKLHTRLHTQDQDIRPYACEGYEGCTSTFKQKEHVRLHIRAVHEVKLTEMKCHLCDYMADKYKNYYKHMRRVHDVKKPTKNKKLLENIKSATQST